MNETVRSCLEKLVDLSAQEKDSVYLVGGSVRDTLLGNEPADLDFALPDAPNIARTLASQTGFPLVALDETPGRETYRVVLDKNLIFDFTTLQGNTIEDDLGQRDFTINAMAIPLADFIEDKPNLIDPFQGREDLRHKVIRVVPGRAFEEDPLRLLRAFRFAATLQFTIEPETLACIQKHKDDLKKTAKERVAYELLILLGAARSHLDGMDQTGLIEVLFPGLAELKTQPGCRSDTTAWEDILNAFAELERTLSRPETFLEHHAPLIKAYLSEHHHYALLKWSALLSALNGRDEAGRVDALKEFRLSNADIQFVDRTLKFSARVLSESRSASRGFEPDSAIYQLIRQSGSELISSLLLSLAIRLGHQEDIAYFVPLMNRILDFYIEVYIPAQDRPALLDGTTLKKRFKLDPSPLFKNILDKVEEARVLGTIHTREEAEQLAEELITSQVRLAE